MMLAQSPAPDIIWWSVLPLLTLAGGGVLLLTVASVFKKLPAWTWAAWTVAVSIGAMATSGVAWAKADLPRQTAGAMLGVDRLGIGTGFVLAALVGLTALLGYDYLNREALPKVEFYVLTMLSSAGGLTMAMSNDLIVLFLGLEVLSISVYVLAAYHLRRPTSQESGLKYFILGAFSSAFFLYGIALTYGATGSTKIQGLSQNLVQGGDKGMLLIGLALLLVGFGFKVGAAPFHTWTPDVYQGAPSPVVGFMASAVKLAAFIGLFRVTFLGFGLLGEDWQPIVYALAVASLLVGSILAVVQTDVKRMLAYSSVSHAGFLLVGIQASGNLDFAVVAGSAVLLYAATYAVMVLGTFAVVTVVGGSGDDNHDLSAYRGLGQRRPVLAFGLTILLLSQAGVPFTTGFIAKLGVITAAADAGSQWLAVIAMLAAVIAGFLYLRIILTMFAGDDHEAEEAVDGDPAKLPVPPGAAVVIALTVAFTVVFGVFPDVIDHLAELALHR